MIVLRACSMLAFLWLCAVSVGAADEYAVEHLDPIIIDYRLSLPELIEKTLAHYPETALNTAMRQESDALQRRGDSWVAGATTLSAFYLDDWVGDDIGSREITADVEIPLWRWGQRSHGHKLAEQASVVVEQQQLALQLKVSGLLRSALWELALNRISLDQAEKMVEFSARQLDKVNKRVELGDLPRSNYLLARSDYLQQRSLYTQAEAELMHARKRLITLTGSNRVPSDFTEKVTDQKQITDQHPVLKLFDAMILRQQAELEWLQRQGAGQPKLTLGMRSERSERGQKYIESAGIGFSLPFGGSQHREPELAKVNVELNRLMVERRQLQRELEQRLHEAKHALEVDEAELAIAEELKEIAKKQLKMSELSFNAGEINLLDLLKIQTQAHSAIRFAQEQNVKFQRDIALYNQAIGVQP